MPQRPPPSPPVLMVLCSIAALAAAWLAVAAEQAVRGGLGALVGVPWLGLVTTERLIVVVRQGGVDGLGAGAYTLMALGGMLVLSLGALALHLGLGLIRTGGWVRALALELAVLSLVWIPSALAAGAVPGGGGPVAELYGRLGDPEAGRWAAAALGLVSLWLLARLAATRTIAVGKAWMRTDGLEFRRRLVRVVSGYPMLVALAGSMYAGGWMPPAWGLAWTAVVFAALVVRTK